jgi:hypothetical protein
MLANTRACLPLHSYLHQHSVEQMGEKAGVGTVVYYPTTAYKQVDSAACHIKGYV